jgi:hypothetical protein
MTSGYLGFLMKCLLVKNGRQVKITAGVAFTNIQHDGANAAVAKTYLGFIYFQGRYFQGLYMVAPNAAFAIEDAGK